MAGRFDAPPRLFPAVEQVRTPFLSSAVKTRVHPLTDEERRTRTIWALGCCCCLYCIVLIAVAIAYAGTNAATPAPTPAPTNLTATPPPMPPLSTGTFTTPPTPMPVLDSGGIAQSVPPLSIELLCNVPFAGNSTIVSYFTYTAATDLFLEAGRAANKIAPRPSNRGQPEYFTKGRSIGGASFAWDRAAGTSLRWTLKASADAPAIVIDVPPTAKECPSLLELVK